MRFRVVDNLVDIPDYVFEVRNLPEYQDDAEIVKYDPYEGTLVCYNETQKERLTHTLEGLGARYTIRNGVRLNDEQYEIVKKTKVRNATDGKKLLKRVMNNEVE